VLALPAIRAVVVAVIDVCEGRGFELGVFHTATIAPVACGLLGYNSYSVGPITTLYAGAMSR
jgi:diphthamide biosynthesis methyltransferase